MAKGQMRSNKEKKKPKAEWNKKPIQADYEVLAQLPERDGDLQYRIKSDREPYQRIVKEGELETA